MKKSRLKMDKYIEEERASYDEPPVLFVDEDGNAEDLGRAIGKPPRVVVTVTDEGLSKSILKAARENGKQDGENENL